MVSMSARGPRQYCGIHPWKLVEVRQTGPSEWLLRYRCMSCAKPFAVFVPYPPASAQKTVQPGETVPPIFVPSPQFPITSQ